jgi:hypothetical protein
VLYISSACRRFVSDAFFFSQASGFFRFGFTLNAVGFFLRLAFLGFDSFLLFTLSLFRSFFCFLLGAFLCLLSQ